MKVLGSLPIAKDTNVKYPFGANIQNETDIIDGTPVVRELYSDQLMNSYKLLEVTGVAPTGTEDNDETQYQIVEALKKLPNEINDINHVLELSGTVWSLPLDLTYLPNKFVCFGQVTDTYVSTETYTFKGIGELELPFNSLGFNSGEEVIIIIDTDGVKAYSLNKLIEVSDTVFTPLGSPIAFNDTNIMYYKENGYFMSDLPSADEIQQRLRVWQSDATLILHDIFVHNGFLVCFATFYLSPTESFGAFYDIDINDFDNIYDRGFVSPITDAYSPYCYMDIDGNTYLTNDSGFNSDDFLITKFERNISGTFIDVSMTPIDATFVKTTNAVIENGFLYTFVAGQLNKFNLTTGVKTEIMFLPSVNGQLFRFNGEVYFTTGEVAKKWILS